VAVIVLLVDERPEEVTDFRVNIGKSAEIVASSNDNPYRRHIEVTEQVLEKAKRMAAQKQDVLVLFDSLTRMTRAYNNELTSRGRTMTGGIDSRAFQMPRPSSGPPASSRRAARSRSWAPSSSIRARAWMTSSSRSSGHRKHGAHLTRELADRRIFPSFEILKSGTRREELLFTEDELKRIHLLRRALAGYQVDTGHGSATRAPPPDRTNAEFLKSLVS